MKIVVTAQGVAEKAKALLPEGAAGERLMAAANNKTEEGF